MIVENNNLANVIIDLPKERFYLELRPNSKQSGISEKIIQKMSSYIKNFKLIVRPEKKECIDTIIKKIDTVRNNSNMPAELRIKKVESSIFPEVQVLINKRERLTKKIKKEK